MATEFKNLSAYSKSELPILPKSTKIAIVCSEWNSEITHALRKGAVDTLVDCGIELSNIILVDVPGSFELTAGARLMTTRPEIDAVIAIGCVIQGETRHFDYVCQGVTQGIAHLNATQPTPVIYCVLTDDNIQQSKERSGGKFGNKGVDCAVAAIKMIAITKNI